MPSRLSAVDLARLRHAGARPAGPPRAGPAPGALAASSCVEVGRLVNASGGITLGNQLILVGSPLARQRARLRLDGQLMHVILQDGVLWRTLPCPIPSGQRHRLQGVRLAGPDPLPEAPTAVQRQVSAQGGIQVARQRIQVGMTHAGKTVTVLSEDTSFRAPPAARRREGPCSLHCERHGGATPDLPAAPDATNLSELQVVSQLDLGLRRRRNVARDHLSACALELTGATGDRQREVQRPVDDRALSCDLSTGED